MGYTGDIQQGHLLFWRTEAKQKYALNLVTQLQYLIHQTCKENENGNCPDCNIHMTLINPGESFDSWYYYSGGIFSILFIGSILILGLIPVYIATVHPVHSKAICNPLSAFMDWRSAWILFKTFEKWLLCNCIPVTFACFSKTTVYASNDILSFSQFKINNSKDH